MKNKLKKAFKALVVFFHRKKIVHAVGYAPSQYYRAVEINNVPHIRVINTNITNGKLGHPMHDIKVSDVVYIEVLQSPFKQHLMRLLGYKVFKKSTIVKIKGGYQHKPNRHERRRHRK